MALTGDPFQTTENLFEMVTLELDEVVVEDDL